MGDTLEATFFAYSRSLSPFLEIIICTILVLAYIRTRRQFDELHPERLIQRLVRSSKNSVEQARVRAED